MTLLAEASFFALPVILGGVTHIVFIKLGVLAGLARVPLDGRLLVRGRRLFGDNKTVRGAVVMIVATAAWSALLARLVDPSLAVAAAQVESSFAWGALLGLGYIVGELPNSFVKRQLGVEAGEAAPGPLRAVFWVIDQVDSLVGALVASCFAFVPSWPLALVLVVITLTVHPAAAAVMVALGLKQRVG